MKVIFLTPTLAVHGGTIVLSQYANRLAEDGHQVTIISPGRGSGLSLHPKITLKTYPALRIRYLDTLLLQSPYWRKVQRLIEECDFLIPIYTPLLWPTVLAKRRQGLKAKIVLIGQEAFEMPIIGPYNRFLLQRKLVRKYLSQVVAVSKPLAESFRALLGREKVALILNGIDLELFKPRKLERGNYLLFVGRPNTPKGYPLFKEAFRQLLKERPGLRAKLIAPEIPSQEDEEIEWIPFADREQLAKLYNQAAVYVCASQAESFGLPAIEAMASGTPVVTTRTAGSAQYAVDKENCLTVPVGDNQALAAAIQRLLTEKELVEKLITAGLATASQYDQKLASKSFIDLLTHLQ